MIYWVFGGTAVGKKHFIAKVLDPATRPDFIVTQRAVAAAVADGPITEDLVQLDHTSDVFVRWQWGRDEILASIAEGPSGVRQCIVMLTASLFAQLSRAALREGSLKWDIGNLTGETADIYELVHGLSASKKIPVLYVQAEAAGYVFRRKIEYQ